MEGCICIQYFTFSFVADVSDFIYFLIMPIKTPEYPGALLVRLQENKENKTLI